MPVNDYIKIDTSTTSAVEAGTLKNAIRQLEIAKQQLTSVINKMGHNTNGTVFTTMEGLYGLPAGSGQTVYDLVNGTIGAMNGTFQNNNSTTLIERVG
jgi:hypothetical protein